MAHYRIVRGSVGPWAEGTIISDDDLKANPGLGGVERLGKGTSERPGLGVIEEASAADARKPTAPHEATRVANAEDPGRSPEHTTGRTPLPELRAAAEGRPAAPAPAPKPATHASGDDAGTAKKK